MSINNEKGCTKCDGKGYIPVKGGPLEIRRCPDCNNGIKCKHTWRDLVSSTGKDIVATRCEYCGEIEVKSEKSKRNWKIDEHVFNYNRHETPFFRPGESVKILITDLEGYNGESFWVTITECKGEVVELYNPENGFHRPAAGATTFKGTVDNDLLAPGFPVMGDVVEFTLGAIITRWG